MGFIPGNGNGNVQKVLRQSDGKLIVVGNFTTYLGQARSRIVRLNSDGSLDGTFNIGTGANNQISTAALLADGKILIGGLFTTFNGTTRNRIARLNSDGSLDATFNPPSGANGNVASIALQPDGKYVISGGFTTYDGVTRVRLARINANGSLDTSADSGIGNDFRFGIRRLMLTADNEILVGGTFKTYGGVARDGIAKLRNCSGGRELRLISMAMEKPTSESSVRSQVRLNGGSIEARTGQTFALQFGSSTDASRRPITPAMEKPTSLSSVRRQVNGTCFDPKTSRSSHFRSERMAMFRFRLITMRMEKPTSPSSVRRHRPGSSRNRREHRLGSSSSV